MMKSFFKKLAFVMALAMVVSAMAPAATAKAADDFGICLQEDANYTIIETYEMTEGDEPQDFKFAGAPKNWKDYKWTWTSSNEKAATVDAKSGLVTVVAAGQTTIKVASDDNAYAGELALTVKAATVAEDKSFTVKQTGSKTVELTFADKKFATADVFVEKLGKTTTGEETVMVWPVSSAVAKENVVTVTTWVDLQACSYRFTVNGEKVVEYLEIGKPSVVEAKYEKPYPYKTAPIEPKVTVKDANGIVLTGYTNVHFELLNKDADAYLETNGKLYLWNKGAVAEIKIVLTLSDGSTVTGYEKVTCEPEPVYTMNNYVEKYAVVKSGTTADKIVWGTTDVIITTDATEKYNVAGLIGGSDKKFKSINSQSATTDTPVLGSEYRVEYASSNPTVALVGKSSGEVLGVKEGNLYVLVTLFKTENGKESEIGVVAAVPVTVKAAKKATDFTLDSYGATLLTKGDFTKVTVKATVKDQYKNDIEDKIVSVSGKVNEKVFSQSTGYVTIAADGKSFDIDAKNFADDNVNNVTFTVKTASGLEKYYTLTVKKLPASVNQTYTLALKGAEVAKKESAEVKVVSSWAGNKYKNASFYWGKPAASVAKQGELYVTITAPGDGGEVKSTWAANATGTAITLAAVTSDSATTGALTNLATGNYIVKLYEITQVTKDSEGKDIVVGVERNVEKFTITKNLKAVTDLKVTANTYKKDNANIIDKSNYTFKYDGKEWKDSANAGIVVSKVTKKELDGKVFVYDFTLRIPFDGETYVEQKITVNELFELAQ